MKYFTPELILRGQSDDADVLDEVEETWEALIVKYNRYIDGVKHHFPPGLKRIEDNYCLHDVDVHAIGRTGDQLVFFLQFDTVDRTLLVLRFLLVEEPHIDREVFPEHFRDKSVIPQWQYDEIELVEGDPPTWRQSILLSNGWELTLHIRDVLVEEIEPVLPGPRQSSFSQPAALPRSLA